MRTRKTAIGAALAVLAVLCAVLATSASAATWQFEETPLEGTETILGGAFSSSMTVPGLTTKCENFQYKIKN